MPLPLLAVAGVIVVAAGLGWAVVAAPETSNDGVAISAHVHTNAFTADGAHQHADGTSHHHLGPATEVAITRTTQRKLDMQLSEARSAVRDIHTRRTRWRSATCG